MKKNFLITLILSLLLCLTYPTYAAESDQKQPAGVPAETVLQLEEDSETVMETESSETETLETEPTQENNESDVLEVESENTYAAPASATQEDDPVEAFVRRLYTNILQRNADPSGLTAWADVLKSGSEQGAKVAQGFIESPEFKKRTLTDREYVQILYRTFFDREADAGGLEAWIKVLESGLSRMHVFRGFAESEEFGKICSDYGIIRGNAALTAPRDQNEGVTKFVARCYRLCLGREADEDGLNGWCRQILNKENTAKEAAYGFIFSNEFMNQNLTDREFVSILYKVFMDREGDSSGLEAWINVLASGKSRTHVFNGFADSVEFQKICAGYGIDSGSGIPIGNDDSNDNNAGNNSGGSNDDNADNSNNNNSNNNDNNNNGNSSNSGNINNGGSGDAVDNTTVYYVPNGDKYHKTSRCTTLKRSKNIYSTTRDKARAAGRQPCKVCY